MAINDKGDMEASHKETLVTRKSFMELCSGRWKKKKKSCDIMYVPLVQAVMPEELVHPSRTADPRAEAPDARGHYLWDRLSSLLSGLRCLE